MGVSDRNPGLRAVRPLVHDHEAGPRAPRGEQPRAGRRASHRHRSRRLPNSSRPSRARGRGRLALPGRASLCRSTTPVRWPCSETWMPLSPSRWHSTSAAEMRCFVRHRVNRLRHHLTERGAAPRSRGRPRAAPARVRPPVLSSPGLPRRPPARPASSERAGATAPSTLASAGVRLRATTSTLPSISTHRNKASQSA